MLRIVPHTVPHVGRSYEHFPDGFELHLLRAGGLGELGPRPDAEQHQADHAGGGG